MTNPVTENFMFKYMYERFFKKEEEIKEAPKLESIPEYIDLTPENLAHIEPKWGSPKPRPDIKLGQVPE